MDYSKLPIWNGRDEGTRDHYKNRADVGSWLAVRVVVLVALSLLGYMGFIFVRMIGEAMVAAFPVA